MPAYADTRPRATIRYVVAAYGLVDGAWAAQLPTTGPCCLPGDPCQLRVDHLRPRKTGPCHPLCVVRCDAHGRSFTLYPPGHVPYGRHPLAPVASDGGRVHAAEGAQGGPWCGTVFDASLDAARDMTWCRGVDGGVEQWWGGSDRWQSTQRVHIELAASMLGVLPSTEDGLRARIADALGVPVMTLRDAAVTWANATDRTGRGQAVVSVLSHVALEGAADRLAVCAHLCGWRGEAMRWDGRRLFKLPFRPTGTGAPGRGG